MRRDLTCGEYDTWADLLDYMDGSAAVIGEMMLPVLRPDAEATGRARSLGLAFQLTNFLRDVDEDLDRGRVYVPQEDLRRFGADPWARRATPSGRPSWPSRSPATATSTARPTTASPRCRAARGAASRPPGCSTPASSSASRPSTTTSSPAGPGPHPGQGDARRADARRPRPGADRAARQGRSRRIHRRARAVRAARCGRDGHPAQHLRPPDHRPRGADHVTTQDWALADAFRPAAPTYDAMVALSPGYHHQAAHRRARPRRRDGLGGRDERWHRPRRRPRTCSTSGAGRARARRRCNGPGPRATPAARCG